MKNDNGHVPYANRFLERMRKALPLNKPLDDDWWISKDGRVGLGSIHVDKIGHPIHFAYDKNNELVCLWMVIFFQMRNIQKKRCIINQEPNIY